TAPVGGRAPRVSRCPTPLGRIPTAAGLDGAVDSPTVEAWEKREHSTVHHKEEKTVDRRDFIRAALGTAAAALTRIQGPEGLLAQAREAARPLNRKVTDLRTFVVDAANDENFVFVKIYTNQGIEGLGEGTLTGKEATVGQAILEHKRYLVGQDPTDIEFHLQGMFRGPRYRGGPVLQSAISAVEIALWDILGQSRGQHMWELLRGRAGDA